ncbi:nucleopolyhedrovirus P10 family protein [Streptomyces sp. NPDC004610]|uniref:nucleopolyhedrovirus P10 family protein n=1 Tax=unclassified Streptomyces TaxID=2593676 RepID=UPI0033A2AF6D
MTEQWARVVRQQVGLGRLLPLGGARDGAWITEDAAAGVLRRAVREVPGVRLGALRIAPAGPGSAQPVVPPPPSALPPGPLRVTADFSAVAGLPATAAEPLPTIAARLRGALGEAAARQLGLTVSEVDLRVTGLLHDEEPGEGSGGPDVSPSVPPSGSRAVGEGREEPPSPGTETTDEERAATAALAVPGVTRLTGRPGGGLGRAVRIDRTTADRPDRPDQSDRADRTNIGATAAIRPHVRVEIAVDTAHRTVEVARKVRTAVGRAVPGRPSVAVLVTAVG